MFAAHSLFSAGRSLDGPIQFQCSIAFQLTFGNSYLPVLGGRHGGGTGGVTRWHTIDITSLAEADHAWVLADVSQGKWLALETTAGRVVLLQENPRYYRGWSFESPKQYKEFCYQHSYVP